MKNKLLFLLPLIALASTGCSLQIGYEFKKTSQSGMQGSNQAPMSYSYFDGDDLGDVSTLTKHTVEMTKEISTIDFKTVEDVTSYLKDEDSFVTSIEEIQYLAKNPYGLRIGTTNEEKHGEITFNLSSYVKKLEIIARPYKAVIETLEGSQVTADTNAALRANNSGFIKLNSALKEDNEVDSTKCSYSFESATNKITVYAGPQRAVIDQIIFYC